MKRTILLLLLAALLFSTGCEQQNTDAMTASDAVQTSMFSMNTYMTFTAYGAEAEQALTESKQLIQDMEARWSVTDDASEVYQANHSAGLPVNVSEETANLIAFTLEMADQTAGALDPTIYPVLTAWGFTTDSKQIPTQQQLDHLLPLVDYTQIQLDGTTLTVPDGMQLDFGAVAKGYTADLVTELLYQYHIQSALISLGGNLQAIGARPDGSDWRIGVRDPQGTGNLGILEISDAAIVTSGGYENYFVGADGKTYWHILNPKTGYPADSGLLSVTIVSPNGRLSDALSTALFVMGAEQAEEYWRQNGGFDMLLVTNEHEILLTEGIADRFSLNADRTDQIKVMKQ